MEKRIKFLGCGRCCSPSTRKEVNYIVSVFSDIYNIIIPLFQKYTLLGFKPRDFLDFVQIAELIKSKDHRTKDGLAKILAINSKMNQRRTETASGFVESEKIDEKIALID